MSVRRLPVLALALAVSLPAAAGDLKGTIRFAGTPPKEAPFPATRDQKVCGQSVPNESLQVSSGHLANVVVTVKGSGLPKPLPQAISIDQRECRYHPHVQATGVGSTLEILNSDPMLHNIHGYVGQQTLFNLAMPIKGQKLPRPLPRAGLVRIKCDVHSWMSAFVVVSDSPYAVVGSDGTYTVRDLPAGTYTVTAWHEKLGEKTAPVTVPASGDVSVDFSFGGTGGGS